MTEIPHEKLDSNENGFETRGESKTKWYVLAALSTGWLSSFHVIESMSSIEDTLISQLNLTNIEFSSLTTIIFLFAIPAALFAPYVIAKTNVYYCLVIAQCTLGFGQFIVYLIKIIQQY